MRNSFATMVAALALSCALPIATVHAADVASPPAADAMEKVRAAGADLFKTRCASCHEPNIERAPNRQQLAQRWPDEIIAALTQGIMKPMAEGLTREQVESLAAYLSGNATHVPNQVDPPQCANPAAFTMKGPSWNGWSPDKNNHRYQANPGLSVRDIPRLKVKWAFTYIGGRYGQPTVVGGRVFLSSSRGAVYSLDAKTGCMYWRFNTKSGARVTLLIGANSIAPSGYAAYFGSYDRNYYALDAASGAQLWETNVETHPRQVLSGAPVQYQDRLIVPISSWEEVVTGSKTYQCCTAHGAVAALDIKTGKMLWKTQMIAPSQPTRINSLGVQMWGPAGAAVWSSPTIDEKRKSIYVGTGNSYTDAPQDGANAIVALNLDTGEIRWKRQMTKDNYLAGCPKQFGPKAPASCPQENGPDFDFGASPFLMKGPQGKEILVAGQKSSQVYGLNPDTGEILWTNQIGKGSALGGVEWGMTTEGKRLYVANADIWGAGTAGLFALDPRNGNILWKTLAPKVPCAWIKVPGERRGTLCSNSNSQAPSMIPGAIFSGTMDGHLRAYDPKNGKIFWDVDTAAGIYSTVNGVTDQPGGSLDAAGPTIVDGMLYVISGYNANLGGFPNNVLLAFSVDGK